MNRLPQIFLFALLLAGTLGAAEFQAAGFHLYYGGEARVLAGLRGRLAKGHVAVVDLRALTAAQRNALLKQSNAVGAKVLAYVSIGELHDREAADFAAFFKNAPIRPDLRKHFPTPASVEVGRNAQFKSRRMDALSAAWRLFVLRKVTRARRAGVHGVFLDTVDTVDTYIARKPWPIARRVESVQAMGHLIRAVKASDPRQYVMMNRGLNLIGAKVFVGEAKGVEITGLNLGKKHGHNPDAVLWENAFAGNDAWTRAKDRELRAIHAAGHTTVFALGYAEVGGKPAAFFKQARAAGWPAAWARSSSTLHRELATGRLLSDNDYLEFPPLQPSTKHIAEQMDESKNSSRNGRASAKPSPPPPTQRKIGQPRQETGEFKGEKCTKNRLTNYVYTLNYTCT